MSKAIEVVFPFYWPIVFESGIVFYNKTHICVLIMCDAEHWLEHTDTGINTFVLNKLLNALNVTSNPKWRTYEVTYYFANPDAGLLSSPRGENAL